MNVERPICFWSQLFEQAETQRHVRHEMSIHDVDMQHVDADRFHVVRVPATERATEAGHAMGGSMVMAGAYAALSGMVGLDALIAGMRESIPSYRTQHIEANESTLHDGFAWGAHVGAPA